MNLPLIAALQRLRVRRQRRRIAIERARLAEMRANASALLAAQEQRVADLEAAFRDGLPSADIARSIERRAKALGG
jgi:hypothetical protein